MDFIIARQNMVRNQITANRVTNPLIINAMAEVPREEFVPSKWRHVAYMDDTIYLDDERSMMEPVALARILQAASIGAGDVVLTIGAGSGYAASIIAHLASVVVALESDTTLAGKATRILANQSIDTVAVVEGALADGYPSQAPYDVIILEGMIDTLPTSLTDQLADGGRLIAVFSTTTSIGRAILFTRNKGKLKQQDLFDIDIPFLPDFKTKMTFVF